jgi:predicted RNase H-like HicB family nuclease
MVLTWSEGEHYWIAEAPDLGAVSADRQTPEDAIAHLQEALRVSLLVAQERGLPIPQPKQL